MFDFHEFSAIKVDDLILLNRQEILEYIKNNQILFRDLVLDFSPSRHIAYGHNQLGHLVKISYENDLVQKIVIVKNKSHIKRVKMVIAYDGSQFHGFQYQSKQRTVQGELNKVIQPMIGSDGLIQGASRTDAGVHAYGQVIHFDSELILNSDQWKDILNHQLPKDIHVLEVSTEHPLFHSRYDVCRKTYVYKIHLGPYDPLLANYYHFDQSLNVEAMRQALKTLEGRHDFSSFSKSKVDDPIREIYHTSIEVKDNVLRLEIVGNGFLRYMVRLIVDYLIKIGKNQAKLSMADVLKVKSRKYTNSIAPAQALYLEKIEY